MLFADLSQVRILKAAEIFQSVAHGPVHARMAEQDHAGIFKGGVKSIEADDI